MALNPWCRRSFTGTPYCTALPVSFLSSMLQTSLECSDPWQWRHQFKKGTKRTTKTTELTQPHNLHYWNSSIKGSSYAVNYCFWVQTNIWKDVFNAQFTILLMKKLPFATDPVLFSPLYMYIYIHKYIYVYIYLYIYTHTHTPSPYKVLVNMNWI